MKKEKILSAFITNLGKYNEGELVGEWVDFPTTNETIQKVFDSIGIDFKEYEEYFITDYESDIEGLTNCFGEFESITELNYLASKIEDLGIDKVYYEAAVENGEYTDSVSDLINLTDNLYCFEYVLDVFICFYKSTWHIQHSLLLLLH